VAKTGIEVADDMLEGKSVKESAKRQIPAGIKRAVFDLDGQSGAEKAKRRRRDISRNGRAIVDL